VKRGKKYDAAVEKLDREHLYGVSEAVDLVKDLAHASFDETVELAVRLGVDPRKADQIVRGTLSLPHGTGRTVRVAVFAAGDAAAEARQAGADEVGADDLVAKVEGGFVEFDVAIATPDLMGQVEPEDGHRDDRRRADRGRVQSRTRRVPHRQGGQCPRPGRQDLVLP